VQRARSELCERSFAHVCESGGMRRTWLKGLEETTKRYLVAAAAHNLGRVLFKLFGVGKPRGLQGFGGVCSAFWSLVAVELTLHRPWRSQRRFSACPPLRPAGPRQLKKKPAQINGLLTACGSPAAATR
jgi:transposase